MAHAARKSRERDESPARDNIRQHVLSLAKTAQRLLEKETDAEARALLEARLRKFEALAKIERLTPDMLRGPVADTAGRTNPAERAWRAALASLKHYDGPSLRDRKRYAGLSETPDWLREQYIEAFGEDSIEPTDGWLRHIAASDAFHTEALLARDRRMAEAKAELLKKLREGKLVPVSRETAE